MVKKCLKICGNILQNLTSNLNSSNSNSTEDNSNFNNDGNSLNEETHNNSTPEFDINMIMKMKTIMDSIKNNKNDPRANLLKSLKPYLNSNRKEKVDQYIQLFNMSKAFEIMNPLGGDKKNGI